MMSLGNLNLTCGNDQKLVTCAPCSVLNGFHIVLFHCHHITNFKPKAQQPALSSGFFKEGTISCSSQQTFTAQ